MRQVACFVATNTKADKHFVAYVYTNDSDARLRPGCTATGGLFGTRRLVEWWH